jgi:hypothetical protein
MAGPQGDAITKNLAVLLDRATLQGTPESGGAGFAIVRGRFAKGFAGKWAFLRDDG